MKDRILNGLMLVAVAAALAMAWLKGVPENARPLPIAALTVPEATAAPSPAEAFRARRREEREMERSLLQTLLDAGGADADAKARAEARLLSLTQYTETEIAVEAALSAQGYDQALCVAQDGSLTLFLPGKVTQDEADYFFNLARDISGLDPGQIRLTGL